MTLHEFLIRSAARHGERTAVLERGGAEVTYRELMELSSAVRDALVHRGVKPGDRVGVYLTKTIDAIAVVFGILRAGAAYVPVDPLAPPARNAYVLADCGVKALLVERRFLDALTDELDTFGAKPAMLVLEGTGGGTGLRRCLDDILPTGDDIFPDSEGLAYILYTSGSTGKPKGVKISHGNAVSFVEWCAEVFKPTPEDRFSGHAPLHFDLSVLDLYTSAKSGASLALIDESTGKNPTELAAYIATSGISIWYSAPSILTLLVESGALAAHDYPALRTVLFAGEVFPVSHLRALMGFWPGRSYYNLYGPTETNVCTYFEIPAAVPEDRQAPYPIGKVCSHLQGRVVDQTGTDVRDCEKGELCIAGPSVTAGYWGLEEQTQQAYLAGSDDSRWYRTGDLVYADQDGDYVFVGRRDRMVKKRGYRVELGEIEACLHLHPDVVEAAVTAITGDAGVRIVGHHATRSGERLSTVALKQFCSQHLPVYMIPDEFRHHQTLPKTSTDKIDYQTLARTLA